MPSEYEPDNLCNCIWFSFDSVRCSMDNDQAEDGEPEDCEDFSDFDEAVDSIDLEDYC